MWEMYSHEPAEPDIVLACAGDIPTQETIAAVSMLREYMPELKVRVVNVVDLMRLCPRDTHPHGMGERGFPGRFHRVDTRRVRLPRLSGGDP